MVNIKVITFFVQRTVQPSGLSPSAAQATISRPAPCRSRPVPWPDPCRRPRTLPLLAGCDPHNLDSIRNYIAGALLALWSFRHLFLHRCDEVLP